MELHQYIDKLYRDHGKELNRLVRRIFGMGPPDPEDLVQEAFSNVLSKQNIQDIKHPKAYIVRSAVNLGLNYQAKHRNQVQDFVDNALERVDESISAEGTPEDLLSLDKRVQSITRAMDALSEKQRELVIRNRVHGETYQQIKQNTGWSLADISRQLNEAIDLLAAVEHD